MWIPFLRGGNPQSLGFGKREGEQWEGEVLKYFNISGLEMETLCNS
jgi:hypothetical protein